MSADQVKAAVVAQLRRLGEAGVLVTRERLAAELARLDASLDKGDGLLQTVAQVAAETSVLRADAGKRIDAVRSDLATLQARQRAAAVAVAERARRSFEGLSPAARRYERVWNAEPGGPQILTEKKR